MSKLLLMASMIMMIVLPIRAARLKNPHRGLKRAVYTTLLFNVGWAMVVVSIMLYLMKNPALLYPESVNP